VEIDPYIVVIVIAIFSIVQSLFGVGLLVFGTPTFLLLGVEYGEAVSYLLPSSLLLSAIQSYGFNDKIRIGRGIVIYAVPFVFLGLIFSVESGSKSSLNLIIGIIMIILSFLRVIGLENIPKLLKKYGRISLIFTGLIHGISNQGGALLTVLMGSIYNDKEKIRTNIAFAYLLFGIAQLVLLLWLKTDFFNLMSIVYGMITYSLYYLVGQFLFNSIDVKFFNKFFTIFMLIYGLLLIRAFF